MTRLTQALPFRSIRRVKQPDIEPVSLADAKDALGIAPEVSDDDVLIAGLIASARTVVEERLHCTLTLTQWQGVLQRFGTCSCDGVEVPYPPFFVDGQHPVEVTWTDSDGTDHVVDAADIRTNTVEVPGRLKVRASIVDSCCESAAVVRWWGGVPSARDVPAPLRTAIVRMVIWQYANRGDDAQSALAADPAIDSLLASCSWMGRF